MPLIIIEDFRLGLQGITGTRHKVCPYTGAMPVFQGKCCHHNGEEG
jgi:hypothetical protein